ncbi:integral membrane protein [Rutstroemia sp. NJR-2017a BBW]|nr:integral membrane protein [Rutstroemia sp. NJR-2017a BBW]
MKFPQHLPLNEIDLVNQPPLHFLQVQDALILLTVIPWSVAYVLYIQQAYRDKSYGMPLFALCSNIAWELVYAFRFPWNLTQFIIFVPWVVIDVYLVYTTIKFGPNQWKHAPLVAQNLTSITLFGIVFMIGAHWTFAETYGANVEAIVWSAFVCQMVLGWASIAQLVTRNDTSGHSMSIWFCRFVGSTAAVVVYCWRYAYYPKDYWMAGTPVGIFLFVMGEVADICYPMLQQEEEQDSIA